MYLRQRPFLVPLSSIKIKGETNKKKEGEDEDDRLNGNLEISEEAVEGK